jgi:hypothetical protein
VILCYRLSFSYNKPCTDLGVLFVAIATKGDLSGDRKMMNSVAAAANTWRTLRQRRNANSSDVDISSLPDAPHDTYTKGRQVYDTLVMQNVDVWLPFERATQLRWLNYLGVYWAAQFDSRNQQGPNSRKMKCTWTVNSTEVVTMHTFFLLFLWN